MSDVVLFAVAIVVPLLALLIEHVGSVRMSERHHSHHDTYSVPASFTRAIVLSMVFMGLLGVIMGWLCRENVFVASHVPVLGFFDMYVLASFVLWWGLRRYRVSTFDDCMVVSPFLGPRVWVNYDEIDRLEWSGLRMESGFRSLDIYVAGKRVVRLRCIVDIEQVIMAIDRFDLLPQTS